MKHKDDPSVNDEGQRNPSFPTTSLKMKMRLFECGDNFLNKHYDLDFKAKRISYTGFPNYLN